MYASGDGCSHENEAEGVDKAGAAKLEHGAESSELDFAKFEMQTRIDSIIKFRQEAAEQDLGLVVEMEKMRAAPHVSAFRDHAASR